MAEWVAAATAFVKWVVTAKTVAAIVVRTAIIIGMNAVASKLAAGKLRNDAPAGGVEQQRQGGALVRRAIALGPTVVFGSEAALIASGNGDDNKTNWRVLLMSDWPCRAVTVWVNGQPLTFAGDINAGWQACNQYRAKSGAPRVWMRFLTGDWEQEADAELVASGAFSTDDRLRGVAALLIKREYDADAFPNGAPDAQDLRVLVDQAPVYDWRDTEQVLTDVRTWRPSTNPVVIAENYLCLLRAPEQFSPGTTDPLVGPGLRWARRGGRAAFRARLTAMANICDVVVDGAPRYRVGLTVRSDQRARDVLTLIADACGGQWITGPSGGYLVPGHVPAPCRTITTAEYTAGEAVSWDPWEAPDQAINTLQVTGPDLERAGELDSVTVVDDAVVLADGGELPGQLDLSACPWPAQRWRVGWRKYRAAQLRDVRRLTVGARHMDLECGDVIIAPDATLPASVSEAWYEITGFGESLREEGHTITLTLARTAASIDGPVPPLGAVADFDPPALAAELAVPTVTVTADPLTGADGAVTPRWRVALAATVVQARARVELQGPAATAGAVSAAPIQVVDLARGDSRPVVAAAGWWRWRAAGRDANGRTGPAGAWSAAAQLVQGTVSGGTTIGTGGPLLVDPLFARQNDLFTWLPFTLTPVTHSRVQTSGGMWVWRMAFGAAPAAGTYAGFFGGLNNRFAVRPGDRIQVAAEMGGDLAFAYVHAFWLDASGLIIATDGGIATAVGAGGTGALSAYTRVGAIVTAPAGAATVTFGVYAYPTPGAAAALAWIGQPWLAPARAEQTQLSAWSPGFMGQPGADVTGSNVAAAIAGQGPLATSTLTEARVRGRFLGEFASESAALAAGLQDGDTWRNTTDGKLYGRSGGASTTVAEPPGTATAKRGRATGTSILIDSGTWTSVASVTVDGPAGLADFSRSSLDVIVPAGTSTSFELRLTRAGVALVNPPAFVGIDGGGAATTDWIEAIQELLAAAPSVAAGSSAYALQGRRTAGTGSVTLTGALDVVVIAS